MARKTSADFFDPAKRFVDTDPSPIHGDEDWLQVCNQIADMLFEAYSEGFAEGLEDHGA